MLLVGLSSASLALFFVLNTQPTTQQLAQNEAEATAVPASSPAEPVAATTTANQASPTDAPAASNTPESMATSSPAPESAISVAVTISGQASFNLSLPVGSNHCQVLSQALSEGKIYQLNMQYNATYKSYGVHQINNVGSPAQVWWTYSVNGRSPPLGCSQVVVKPADQVVWTYQGD